MITHETRTSPVPDDFQLSLLPVAKPELAVSRRLHESREPVWPAAPVSPELDRLHVLMSRPDTSFGHHRTPAAQELTQQATRWLQKLPVPVRPVITARRHPHVINRLCTIWGDVPERQAYFQELLFSSRPGRRGFSFEVMDELVELQSFGTRARKL